MNVLALDLGSQCGYALRSRGVTCSGTVSFHPRKLEQPGHRWLRFRAQLDEWAKDADLGVIYAEELIHMPSNQLATIVMFGGFRATLQTWAALRNVRIEWVNVSTIKKHWTGRGNAKKVDMLRVARERGFHPADDNQADALALLDYALCAEGEPTPTAIEIPPPPVDAWVSPFATAAA